MHPHLQRAHDLLDRHAGGLTCAELVAQPPGKWSIAEILEHLARAFSATTRGLDRTLASGEPPVTAATARQRVIAFILLTSGRMPTGRPAPKATLPVGLDPETALTIACENLRTLDAALERCAGRFGERVKVLDHPILGAFSVAQWRKFQWVHTRHHARQIENRRR
jgi:hypothetical protein